METSSPGRLKLIIALGSLAVVAEAIALVMNLTEPNPSAHLFTIVTGCAVLVICGWMTGRAIRILRTRER